MAGVTRESSSSWQKLKDQYLQWDTATRRKNYFCDSNYVTPDEIIKWSEESHDDDQNLGLKEPKLSVDTSINQKISLWQGDITLLEVDAVVNAANKELRGGGGVDGAIHSGAGRESLQAECRTLKGCPTGESKITGGYKLPAKYVIHTVGPMGEKPELLASCYRKSLQLAVDNNLKTIVRYNSMHITNNLFIIDLGIPMYFNWNLRLSQRRSSQSCSINHTNIS